MLSHRVNPSQIGILLFTLFWFLGVSSTMGETLAELLEREGINPSSVQSVDLAKKVTSGDVLDTAQSRVIATYAEEAESLSDSFYLFLLSKPQGRWSAVRLRWPDLTIDKKSCTGGSILSIAESKGFIFLQGHFNPSASCTMIVTRKELQFYDTFFGAVVASFSNGNLVYDMGGRHFAPTHYVELSLYNLASKKRQQFYPMKPYQSIRLQHIERVKEEFDDCDRDEESRRACDGYFQSSYYSHFFDPELFDNELEGGVVISDATDALAFMTRFDSIDNIVEDHPRVVYVYRNVTNGKGIEYRELLYTDLVQSYGQLPLNKYLEADILGRIFSQKIEIKHNSRRPNPRVHPAGAKSQSAPGG
jgi:hypothetical protein